MRAALVVCGLLAVIGALPSHAAEARTTAPQARKAMQDPIAWRDWSDQVFADARAQKKYVLLDLGAVWCHWCHVMDATTYHDPKVAKLIRDHFIPVRVDQDAQPDLSRRYEAFGWPATIVMDADGNDIGRMRGYREPARFAGVLQAILDDPSPLRSAAETAASLPGLRRGSQTSMPANSRLPGREATAPCQHRDWHPDPARRCCLAIAARQRKGLRDFLSPA